MRTPRVYADAALNAGEELSLDERAAHHVVRVLRRRRGDALHLFDGRGREANAEIVEAHRHHGCRVRIDGVRSRDVESPIAIELAQAMIKGDRMDWVVQKATELGVATIRPTISARSEVQPRAPEQRLARWREIAIHACEQCGRTRLPAIHAPVPLEALAPTATERIVLAPEGRPKPATRADGGRAVCIAVGPEGGLDASELDALAAAGFEAMAFGPRVLRAETAAIAVTAWLQARRGDLLSAHRD